MAINDVAREWMYKIFFVNFSVIILCLVFTTLHGMQTQLAMRILSVRLSVTRVDCDKTVERSVQIYTPYERTFSLIC